jgi:exopolysaccharide biosynthesis polyprenyl glycosylphosphotransferase
MFRRFSVNFALFSMGLDALIISGTLYLAAYWRSPISDALPFVKNIPARVDLPPLLYLVFPTLWVGILVLFSVYDGRRNLKVNDEIGTLMMGSLLATISLAGVLFMTFRDVSRFLFLLFAAGAFMLLVAWRLTYRVAFRWQMVGQAQTRRVLVLGAGMVGTTIANQVRRHNNGVRFVGYLDDDLHKRRLVGVLGTLGDVRTVIAQCSVDDVIITLPRSAYDRLNQVVGELHDLAVRVWVVPDYFALTLHKASVEEFAGIPMMDLRAPALSEYQRMTKRAFDLALSLLALPFVLPAVGLIALAVRLDSRGPIFYRQLRAGENGRLFQMVKFRTMVANADQLQHLVATTNAQGQLIHKSPSDPRVTRVGRFLRRTSLDELPQLFNVIQGEMSLVGPRPEMPYLVEKYDLWQRKRFAVPQGITGWWQVNGRSDKPMHLHTEEDLYYVQHYSLWLDIQIIMKTIWTVLRGRGAF